MFSAPGAVLGQPSTSAVILLLLSADAIRILVRLRSWALQRPAKNKAQVSPPR
eukprot:SAG25_NODE_47_length_18954_cov_11.266295_25_plen_53_part_00